jgi:hypothetical protein
MRSLRTRVERLEGAGEPDGLRPVLLVTSQSNVEAELEAWQERYGPCDAEPLFIQLVGV